ncbi:DNA-3-methyladenine glycosylase [Paenibacillus alvei]|uniref:DNA-3-methyladenine glycosylase II n=1 Tax=Paenibacillus alvei TaxID=44250 RepID=A0ABT4GYF6_PAEAL|nr:DNA-3-methyladenine glycosylase [Paenibacillus alvei]MCY7482935.1 DNA-3-methyladenine glycosylase [Paenibacillus alvei]MCY9761755.1 DNA-3-methyladenine glycosylase [Paenibacillus alvei]MCY9769797.1 DNA-3-methyladenine glycosylase [Paenibacillus alvei]
MTNEYAYDPIKLDVPREFSFTENLNYLSRASNECLYEIHNQKVYKAIPLGNRTPIIEISANQDQSLRMAYIGNEVPLDSSEHKAVQHYIRDWFDLDTDLSPFYELAHRDPLLHDAVHAYSGLRIMGIPDLFEALSWGIIGQQINLTYAYTLKRRLVEQFGKQLICEDRSYWIYPTAEDIAALSIQDLQQLRMTERKCEYLIQTAQLIANKQLTKEMLLGAGGCKQAEEMLTQIRGIGPWTANYVLMRCLRMPSAFPIDDVGLHNAVRHVLASDRKPTKSELRAMSVNWSGWEAYATFYLWRYLY